VKLLAVSDFQHGQQQSLEPHLLSAVTYAFAHGGNEVLHCGSFEGWKLWTFQCINKAETGHLESATVFQITG
jgi:hypothetical protein